MEIARALFSKWTTILSIDNAVVTQIRARNEFAFCWLASMCGSQTQVQLLRWSYNIENLGKRWNMLTRIITAEHKCTYERKRSCVYKTFIWIVLLRLFSVRMERNSGIFTPLMLKPSFENLRITQTYTDFLLPVYALFLNIRKPTFIWHHKFNNTGGLTLPTL
jgi:hypothetical protein